MRTGTVGVTVLGSDHAGKFVKATMPECADREIRELLPGQLRRWKSP